MTVWWVFMMIFLDCGQTDASLSPTLCPCNGHLKTICPPSGADILLPCPNTTGLEMTFKLLKDQEVVSRILCNREHSVLTCNVSKNGPGVHVNQSSGGESVSFILNGVSTSSPGSYRCDSVHKLPPPFRTVEGVWNIQILEGHLCECNKDSRNTESKEIIEWIWILVVTLLTIFCITVTIIAFVLWVKLRNKDSHTEYTNTKPRAAGPRKRNKGLHKPVPRHF